MTSILPITATFLDEISHDIPHQNWGKREWALDFAHMKAMGIDTVVLIRSGYRNYLTYPSPHLLAQGCFEPPVDLVALFLDLAAENNMQFYFGTYDSGLYWDTGDMGHEVATNLFIIEEAWQRYGHHPAFAGWYLSLELSRKTKGSLASLQRLGHQCKAISNGLPVLISPWIDGKKAIPAKAAQLEKKSSISLREHGKEWDEIFAAIQGSIDIVAFQDGHVALEELPDYLRVNKALADKYRLTTWTNSESFDRDMPIKFLPIKFEKMLHKLRAAKEAGCGKAITFEFSHFMSPQSSYPQAHHLYNRYCEYLDIKIQGT